MSASELGAGRHRSVQDAARWLEVNPSLPEPLAVVSRMFETTARLVLEAVEVDDPELTRALVLLTQAKDAAVRAKIAEGRTRE